MKHLAEQLLAEFPHFDPGLARNEGGATGGKAVTTDLRAISPAYRRLYDAIGGSAFLELVSRFSGIPDLILDPKMFGGGTHTKICTAGARSACRFQLRRGAAA